MAVRESLVRLEAQVARLERENAVLRAEVDRLARDNNDQLDVIFELQQMNQRGREDR